MDQIKIRFHKPGMQGFTRDVEMKAVPRAHDEIKIRRGTDLDAWEGTFSVHVVEWCPDETDFDAYVVLR